MKWEDIEPEQNQFDFGPADEIVKEAQTLHAKVRGHNFMWYVTLTMTYDRLIDSTCGTCRNNQLAPWVTTNLTAVELDRALQNHITKILNHYRGQLYAVDVVVRFHLSIATTDTQTLTYDIS